MVLLSSLAMHPARSRSTRHAPPSSSSSSSDPKYASPLGYSHTNGYFYSPSHSEDSPSLSKGFSPAPSSQQPFKGRRNSGPAAPHSSTMTSPVTSPGVYSSLSSLDTWSPSTVSVASLLAHSADMHSKSNGSSSSNNSNNKNSSSSSSNNSAFILQVNGDVPRSRAWGSDTTGIYSASSATPSAVMPATSGSAGASPRERSLRRSVSADPNSRDREQQYFPTARPLGSPRQDPGIPRVCSDGDLLESEYVTLDYTYTGAGAGRGGQQGQRARRRLQLGQRRPLLLPLPVLILAPGQRPVLQALLQRREQLLLRQRLQQRLRQQRQLLQP